MKLIRQTLDLSGRWDLPGQEEPEEAFREGLIFIGATPSVVREKTLELRNGVPDKASNLSIYGLIIELSFKEVFGLFYRCVCV